MKTVSHVGVIACFSLSFIAFAGPQPLGSFEDMKTACRNPAKFHNQIAPTNIQVSCKNVQLKWIPDAGTTLTMETNREITAQVNSDKYTTSAETRSIPSEAQIVSCPVFKQVLETVEASRVLTCEQLLGFEGTAISFCASVIDSLISENPESVNIQPTGRIFNMCTSQGNPAQQQIPLPEKGREQSEKNRKHVRIF